VASEKTRVSEEIIRRFGVVLQTLASGRKINSAEFGKYAVTTAPWYYMPAAFHKVLMHREIIINLAVFPFSEEASEAKKK
jgi:hypothetical protein